MVKRWEPRYRYRVSLTEFRLWEEAWGLPESGRQSTCPRLEIGASASQADVSPHSNKRSDAFLLAAGLCGKTRERRNEMHVGRAWGAGVTLAALALVVVGPAHAGAKGRR